MDVMDEQKHWDSIGSRYDEELLDVFRLNKARKLHKYLKKQANPNHRATDFGRGTGKSFPYLALSFNGDLAIDISHDLKDMEGESGQPNVPFMRIDLTEENLNLPQTAFAFCCTVAT